MLNIFTYRTPLLRAESPWSEQGLHTMFSIQGTLLSSYQSLEVEIFAFFFSIFFYMLSVRLDFAVPAPIMESMHITLTRNQPSNNRRAFACFNSKKMCKQCFAVIDGNVCLTILLQGTILWGTPKWQLINFANLKVNWCRVILKAAKQCKTKSQCWWYVISSPCPS